MLGRTASGLFWMMRYLERFENTARLIDAGFRLSLTRARSSRSEWESVLTTAG
ncbi:MAG: alpha-E domain-containing protein, partial [Pseudomonadota bacterium]